MSFSIVTEDRGDHIHCFSMGNGAAEELLSVITAVVRSFRTGAVSVGKTDAEIHMALIEAVNDGLLPAGPNDKLNMVVEKPERTDEAKAAAEQGHAKPLTVTEAELFSQYLASGWENLIDFYEYKRRFIMNGGTIVEVEDGQADA